MKSLRIPIVTHQNIQGDWSVESRILMAENKFLKKKKKQNDPQWKKSYLSRGPKGTTES